MYFNEIVAESGSSLCVYISFISRKIKTIMDETKFVHKIFPFGQISEHLFYDNLFEKHLIFL